VFNLSGINLKESTILKVINGDIDGDIVYEMKHWNKSGGKILAGLVKRRDAEAEMWLGLGFNP
jgi:lysozyme|tara:strand:+ start:2803 stop:2991 length:189 start_codon:yes stop_codon:yes gene_type:complete